MSNAIWTSEPIHLSVEVSVDVSASLEGVTLGETANGVLATDLRFTANQAQTLGNALITAAAIALEAQRAGK